ncbi:MAG TPA: N-acetylmuramoyl-L-alanine amidase [Thermoanaerobaculia bacterium]|nr:N-acetylmuramoyl-L-alanine amidase [Thermoanaerobaculia bacterium]
MSSSTRFAPGKKRLVFSALAVGWLLASVLPLPARADPSLSTTVLERKGAGDGLVAVISGDQRLSLEAAPRPGEGLLAFTRRFTGDSSAVARVAAANGRVHALSAGVRYRIPFDLLDSEYQLKVTRALFGDDRVTQKGWEHRVGRLAAVDKEGLWQIASWFTGDGRNFSSIRSFNHLHDTDVNPGERVTIPASLLLPAFRSMIPEAGSYRLVYGKDSRGPFAIYHLRAGEALYSSVVVRFTGRVFAADVNALAQEIAKRSGISDVTTIPVGFPVKIPLDLLQPEFLPADSPARQRYEASLAASGRFSNQVRAQHLEGITVVLDAGHGGRDVGTSVDGVWESLYVYDVMLRVRRLLQSRTAARVFATTRDGPTFKIVDRDVLPYSHGHEVLTNPPYPIVDATVGVHLRWYLANSILHHIVRHGGDPRKVIFISIHADSLHPSLRGVMAYVPGADLRGGTFGKHGAVYAARREVREEPTVRFSEAALVRSEGLSRQLASKIIGAFRGEHLPVHPFKPVREKIIRHRHAWVPAVLRYNKIPAKVLLEICNLNNRYDRHLVVTRAYRAKVAEAIVDGILRYYGDGHRVEPIELAAKAR